MATGRNQEALDALKAEINCAVVAGDLAESGVCRRVVEATVKEFGGLSTLVNCAGQLVGGAFGDEKLTS